MLVGAGDNGADGLLAGVRLRARGVAVDALLVGSRWYEPGLGALVAAGGRCIDATTSEGRARAGRVLGSADLVLDAVVGLRGRPGLSELVVDLLAQVGARTPVVAVDLPSGVDPESGETPAVHVRADVTVALGVVKPCLFLPPAAYAVGQLEVVDVGLGRFLPGEPVVRRLTTVSAGRLWPAPRLTDHKYTRGVLGMVAGSVTYPGAAVMACLGAVHAGVGIVKYVGPAEAAAQIIAARPEVEPRGGRVGAWVIGPGVFDDPAQDAAIEGVLDAGLPHVVDAGGLEACVRARAAGRRATPGDRVLLTPHAGELARLLALVGREVSREQVEAQPWRHAQLLARSIDATVLIKGPTTLVVPPSGPTYSQADGPAWLAAAGSGDVLAGIAGALIAAGLDAALVGALAAHVHGRAGHRASAGGPAAAADVAAAVPAVIAELLATRNPDPGATGRGRRGSGGGQETDALGQAPHVGAGTGPVAVEEFADHLADQR
jgi:hydroxyethylthiazole kinase-like uncharacterized protein yjeF